MEKVEQYIKEHTRNTYNYNSYEQDPTPWLTPDDARIVAEKAREEIYEWLQENAFKYATVGLYTDAMITDLKIHLENKL